MSTATARRSDLGKRRYQRTRPHRHWLNVRVGDSIVRAPVYDLSVGGLLAIGDRETSVVTDALVRDTYLECALERPDGTLVNFAALLVDDVSQRRGLALRFLHLDEVADRILRHVVAEAETVDGPEPIEAEVAFLRPAPPALVALPAHTETSSPMPGSDTDHTQVENQSVDADALETLKQQMASLLRDNARLNQELRDEAKEADNAYEVIARLTAQLGRGRSR
jgi:hypothetical protein